MDFLSWKTKHLYGARNEAGKGLEMVAENGRCLLMYLAQTKNERLKPQETQGSSAFVLSFDHALTNTIDFQLQNVCDSVFLAV